MKVLGLKAQNLRNIEVVAVDLKGRNFVEIRGENGAGKTTLIDILFGAMVGNKFFGGSKQAWQVVKAGKDKALLTVNLIDGKRTIQIQRSITKREKDGKALAGGSLKITDTEGRKLGQDFLDSLISVFTVDVRGFAQQPIGKQVELMYDLIAFDQEAYEEKMNEAMTERRDYNRELKRVSAVVESTKCEEIEAVSLQTLMNERRDIEAYNNTQLEFDKRIDIRREDIERADERIQEAKIELEDIEKRKLALLEQITKTAQAIAGMEKEVEAMPKPTTPKSFDAVEHAIENAQTINSQADQYKAHKDAEKQHAMFMEKRDEWQEAVDKLQKGKADALTNSKLPFKNLTIDDEVGLVIGDVPFSQKSGAEQIRISSQIGMKMKPELKVLCVRDGSLLDKESFEVVKELAEKNGYQVLLEKVGEKAGEDSIVLKEGVVISSFERPKTTAEKVKDMESEL